MNGPCTYAEWVAALDRVRLVDEDEESISRLEAGRLEWSPGVAERATAALQAAIEACLRRNSDLLGRDLGRTRNSTDALVCALLAARRRFRFAVGLAQLPAFPDYVKESFVASVCESAARAQKSLEESAARDRTGEVARAIRNNPLDPSRLTPTAAVTTGAPGTSKPRRVILP